MAQLLKGIGKQIQVGIAKETTRGTAMSTAGYWIPIADWNIDERFENAVDVETYGVIEDSVGQTRVKDWSEGQFKMPLTGTSAGVLFQSLFGSDTFVVHAGETKVYDHTLVVGQSVQHSSVTFFIHDPIPTANSVTADYTHANGVVHKIVVDYSLGKFVDITADVKALKGSSAAVAFVPSQTQETRFVPQYMTFKLASVQSGLTGATAIKIKSAKITIDAGDEDDLVLGTTAPRDFLNKEFKIEGEIEAIWQNETDFKVAALANTSQAMRIDLQNSDNTIGVVPTNPQFRFDLYKVYFTEFNRPIKIKDIVYQTIKFKAAYSIPDSLMAKLLIVNNLSTVY